MEPVGKNPFIGKEPDTSKKGHYKFETFYFNLTDGDDLDRLGEQLAKIVNHGCKFSIIEFTSGNKVDGTPYVILRLREDKDLLLKKNNDITIKVDIFSSRSFDQMDVIINNAFNVEPANDVTKLIAEKRFAHVILDVCIILIWAEIKKGSKFMEATNGLRSLLTSRF